MEKSMSFAFVAGGVLLLIFGASATHSLSADISRFLNGSLSGKAVWMMLAGLVLSVIGLMDALRRAHRGWWDNLYSPLAFLVIAVIAGLQGFSSNTSLTTSIAEVFFVVSLVLFLVSLLQSKRR
jgi:uncharacterized membrane protein YtjA (UPF0391 family)